MSAPTPPKPPANPRPGQGRHRADPKKAHEQLRMKDLLKRK